MTEIGIQVDTTLESWQQRPSVLRRPVARRPRVKVRPMRKDASSNIGQESDQQPEIKNNIRSRTENVQEHKKDTINASLNLEEGIVPFNDDDEAKKSVHVKEKAAILQKLRRSESYEVRKKQGRISGVHAHNIKNITKDEQDPDSIETANNINNVALKQQIEKDIKQPQIRSTTYKPISSRRRAASFDDAYRRKMSDDNNFMTRANYTVEPEVNIDAGSQILNSYSSKLEYVGKSSKSHKRRPVRNFFRRLAGSLESLLKIRRKPRRSEMFSSTERVHAPRSYNNPLFSNYSPYVTVDDCVDGSSVGDGGSNKTEENRAYFSIFRDSLPQHSSREENVEFTRSGKKASKLKNSDSKRIAFSRGKRVYLSPGMKNETEEGRFYPVPPQISGRRKKHSIRRANLRNSFASNDHKTDWETRSETGSQSIMFKSDNLRQADVNLTMSSESENGDDFGIENPRIKLTAEENEENNFTSNEVCDRNTKKSEVDNTNVNIADFFPKCDVIKPQTLQPVDAERAKTSRSTSRSRSRSSSRRRPVKAQLPVESLPPPERTASVGKFDAKDTVNGMRRKPRRRNSSFVPSKRASNKQITIENGLKQAPSFEQLINGLQEVVNNLGQVGTDSRQSLNSTSVTKNQQPASSNKTKSKRVSPKRNESWVGAVSSRLDELLDERSSKESIDKRVADNKNLFTKTTREHNSRSSSRKRYRKQDKRTNVRKSVVKCEKISFDDLEKDFQNFAHEIRQRQSSEKMNTIGN